MAEGIHVFGSASMGALRAAELHQFGMRGIGRIFEAYRAGELEDDDEVAVIHGPPRPATSRCPRRWSTSAKPSAAAERNGIVAVATRDALIRIAKELFYHDRTFERLLERAAERSMPPPGAALRAWLPQGGSTGSAGTPSPCSRRCRRCCHRARADAGRLRPGGPRCGTRRPRLRQHPGSQAPAGPRRG